MSTPETLNQSNSSDNFIIGDLFDDDYPNEEPKNNLTTSSEALIDTDDLGTDQSLLDSDQDTDNAYTQYNLNNSYLTDEDEDDNAVDSDLDPIDNTNPTNWWGTHLHFDGSDFTTPNPRGYRFTEDSAEDELLDSDDNNETQSLLSEYDSDDNNQSEYTLASSDDYDGDDEIETLLDEIEELEEALVGEYNENANLIAQNEQLIIENTCQRLENGLLEAENKLLRAENDYVKGSLTLGFQLARIRQLTPNLNSHHDRSPDTLNAPFTKL